MTEGLFPPESASAWRPDPRRDPARGVAMWKAIAQQLWDERERGITRSYAQSLVMEHIQNDAYERAAKVAEAEAARGGQMIAASIRALKSKAGGA